RIPVDLPGERTSTRYEPAPGLWGSLAERSTSPRVIDASVWVGYVGADEPRSAASVVVTGTDAATVKHEAACLAKRYWDVRHDFAFCAPTGTMDWCIAQAITAQERPVVISDSGDNPTAGGVGDTPYALERLLAYDEFANGERT